ncbi:hypothetical protein [Leifsonia sp. EB34]|uniref:hypothetical protein n=1 Tax=Leifsonia sp. EB34 TaxID=3156303 RepID=UPI00351842F5
MNDIIEGVYPPETQVPSTNEFAAFYRINPATVGRGVNLLADEALAAVRRARRHRGADTADRRRAALITLTGSWPAVGAWFVANEPVGVTAWLLIPTALAALAGFAVLRRATPRT